MGEGLLCTESVFFKKKEPKLNRKKILSVANSQRLNLFSLAYSEIVCLLHYGLILQHSEQLNFFQDDGIGDRVHFLEKAQQCPAFM